MTESVIAIEHLHMSYRATPVLQDVSLTVYPGEIVGYIGPNGAGKSTTVKLMLGLVAGYQGHIRIFGEDIATADPMYKQNIGYVPEAGELYDNLTAAEYLTFVGELYGLSFQQANEKAAELMRLFGLANVYQQRLATYSKGMRQKVLLVASLLHNPDLLFLDEPIAGLDANSVMIVKEILAELAAAGKTILYSSHIMDVVEKISHRIILLHDGQVAADGSFASLQQQNQEGSLEDIFNDITGFTEHQAIARDVASVVEEV